MVTAQDTVVTVRVGGNPQESVLKTQNALAVVHYLNKKGVQGRFPPAPLDLPIYLWCKLFPTLFQLCPVYYFPRISKYLSAFVKEYVTLNAISGVLNHTTIIHPGDYIVPLKLSSVFT